MKIQKERLTIQIFHFNPVQVNTLVAFDDSNEAVIVDPGIVHRQRIKNWQIILLKISSL